MLPNATEMLPEFTTGVNRKMSPNDPKVSPEFREITMAVNGGEMSVEFRTTKGDQNYDWSEIKICRLLK
jgi:hypothetical protein